MLDWRERLDCFRYGSRDVVADTWSGSKGKLTRQVPALSRPSPGSASSLTLRSKRAWIAAAPFHVGGNLVVFLGRIADGLCSILSSGKIVREFQSALIGREPVMSVFNEALEWRDRAERAQQVAGELSDPGAKQAMLQAAKGYEHLARAAAAKAQKREFALGNYSNLDAAPASQQPTNQRRSRRQRNRR
jgi:hypothetical protein